MWSSKVRCGINMDRTFKILIVNLRFFLETLWSNASNLMIFKKLATSFIHLLGSFFALFLFVLVRPSRVVLYTELLCVLVVLYATPLGSILLCTVLYCAVL